MKILVPTDFSDCAKYALDAAILIAKKTAGEVYLTHVFNPLNIGFYDVPEDSEFYKKSLKQKLELMKDLEDYVKSNGVEVRSDIFNNDLTNSILYVDSYFDSDLIVMGSHGVSGKQEWFIGSNAQKVVRKLHKKVFVVKEPFTTATLKKACYVTGLETASQAAFKDFLEFIKIFDVDQLDILTIDTSSYFSQPTFLMKSIAKELKEIAHEFNVKANFYQDFTIARGVEHFTNDQNINLIGISNKERHPLKRIFQGSNVEMIVNHSSVPVLTIDG